MAKQLDIIGRLKKEVDNYPFIVLIQPKEMYNMIRIHYSKRKGGVITKIEEINHLEEVKVGCSFRGRSYNCDAGAEWIREFKAGISGIRQMDWINNDCYVDCYTKNG